MGNWAQEWIRLLYILYKEKVTCVLDVCRPTYELYAVWLVCGLAFFLFFLAVGSRGWRFTKVYLRFFSEEDAVMEDDANSIELNTHEVRPQGRQVLKGNP
jgi:hypothetical protein